MFEDFGCKPGQTLFISDLEYKKVLHFKVVCLKLFEDNNYTAHGYMECPWALPNKPFNIPKEFSLKKLNKRIVFTARKDAEEWLENNKDKNNRKKVR